MIDPTLITPVRDQILFRRTKSSEEVTTESGLVVKEGDPEQKRSNTGTVLAIGPGPFIADYSPVPLPQPEIQVGDLIYFPQYNPDPVDPHDKDCEFYTIPWNEVTAFTRPV